MSAPRSSLSLYLTDIRAHSRLKADEEERVARACRSDRACLDRLVEANLSFVVKLAKEFRNRGVPFEDLISEGNVGLILAARRYDPRKGAKFITYAAFWIRKEMRRALADQSSMIRVPDYQRRKVRAQGGAGGSADADHPIEGEWPVFPRSYVSLDLRVGQDGESCLGDLLVSPSIGPEREAAEQDVHRRLHDAVSSLSSRCRTILSHRFGLGDREPATLRALAARLGMSHERVRQLEGEAKRQVRALFAELSHP